MRAAHAMASRHSSAGAYPPGLAGQHVPGELAALPPEGDLPLVSGPLIYGRKERPPPNGKALFNPAGVAAPVPAPFGRASGPFPGPEGRGEGQQRPPPPERRRPPTKS